MKKDYWRCQYDGEMWNVDGVTGTYTTGREMVELVADTNPLLPEAPCRRLSVPITHTGRWMRVKR